MSFYFQITIPIIYVIAIMHSLYHANHIIQLLYRCYIDIRLCEKYGKKELEMACTKVLSYTASPSIRLISTILKNGTYKSTSPKTEPHDYTNAYGITRGAAYYAKNGKDGKGR